MVIYPSCTGVKERQIEELIDEAITKYSTISITPYKKEDSKIIFKNISTKGISQTFSNNLSYEKFAINFYKQNGYNAFFAENTYWLILYSMLYDYENFISSSFFYELISKTIPTTMESITEINFNTPKHIPNITNQIINAYFKNICTRVPPNEFYNKNYSCGLRDNFKVDQFISTTSHLTEKQLILIFERMFDDLKYYLYGFPDLIVYNDDEFFFVEVKSKNDNPSFKQIQWHKFLSEVVGVDVVLFMIDKDSEQVIDIKKMYDVELLDSKKRKNKNIKLSQQEVFIDWNDDKLNQLVFDVSDDEFRKLVNSGHAYFMRHWKYAVNEYTRLSRDDFKDSNEWTEYHKLRRIKEQDIIYKKAKELYYSPSFGDYRPTKRQLERNKKAKSYEDNGEYSKAINLYMENIIEKTGSPVTYKRLIYILNKFERFDDVIKLMDIAIPIFVALNDKNNALRFIYQKSAAIHGNKSTRILYTSKNYSKPNHKKNEDKQTDLSSYFN